MIGKNRSDAAGLLEPWEVGILSPSTQTPPAQAEKRCAAGAQSVERALYLLQMIGEEDGPVSLPVLCERTGLNRTTVWRLLSTLEKYHFLCRNPKTKDYDLGYGATMLCTAPQRRYATLIRRAQPAMERLVEHTQESLVLSVPHAGGTLVVYQMDSPLSIRLKDYTNQITPLWNTSNGKVLLADLPPRELEHLLRQQPMSFSLQPVEDLEAVREAVRLTAQRGYGTVEGEWSMGENGISAPIYAGNQLVAFLGIGGPDTRFTHQDMEDVAPLLCSACTEIGADLL